MLFIDRREVTEHEDIPSKLKDIPVTITTLEAGDYAFLDVHGEPQGIERCKLGNLIQKLRSGELEDQLNKCEQAYTKTAILVEDVYDNMHSLLASYRKTDKGYYRTMVYPNTTYTFLLATLIRLSELGVELFQTANLDCSMEFLKTFYLQRTKPEEEHTLFKKMKALRMPTKLTANPTVPRLMALCPRLPEKVAIRMVNKYDTIWGIIHAPDEELLTIQGLGSGLLNHLKETIGKGEQ